MAIFRGKGRRGGGIFGRIVKYIVDHPRSEPIQKLVIDDKKIKHLSFQYYEIAQTNAALLLFTSWN